MSAKQVLAAVRKMARKNGLTVEQLPKRGKGSHTIWIIVDLAGKEHGRIALTGHSGTMSWTVTRTSEKALEHLFGEGWLEK